MLSVQETFLLIGAMIVAVATIILPTTETRETPRGLCHPHGL